MLGEFLKSHRAELIRRCRAKAEKRASPDVMGAQSENGIPQFLDQLVETFRKEQSPEALARHRPGTPSLALVPSDIAGTATKYGRELRRQGLTVDQVVHAYGDLCQALTELAMEEGTAISVDEFHTFNRCSDNAIADAVTSYVEMVEVQAPAGNAEAAPYPALKIRQMAKLIESALQSFVAIQSGSVGTRGTTAALHEKSLTTLRDLIAGAAPRDDPADVRAIISPAAPR